MRRELASHLVRAAAVGLVALAATSPTRAGDGLPDARRGIRTAPLLLLARVDVRAELRLSPEQSADAERTISDLHEKAQALKGRNDGEAVAARGEIESASLLWIERSLTPPQRDRLIQLDYQWEGPSAVITRPKVAETLALTDAQRASFARAVAERNQRRGIGGPIAADEAELAGFVREGLTEGQERLWQTIIGPPFAFRTVSPPGPAGTAAR